MLKKTWKTSRREKNWLAMFLAAAVATAGGATLAWAVKPAASQATVDAQPLANAEKKDPLASPRETVKTFLLAMQDDRIADAVACLDLSEIPEDQQAATGPERARLLNELIKQLPPVKEETIPDDPKFAGLFELAQLDEQRGVIVLSSGKDGRWRFSTATVAMLPEAVKAVPTSQPAATAGVPPELRSARATVETFQKAMEESKENDDRLAGAVGCLDLSQLGSGVRKDKDSVAGLATKLWNILNHADKKIILAEISNEADAPPVDLREGLQGSVVLQRVEDGRWLFSARTVEEIPELFKELVSIEMVEVTAEGAVAWELWIESQIPEWLRPIWLGLEYWQWLGLGLLILLGIVLDPTVRWLLNLFIVGVLHRHHLDLDASFRRHAIRPLGLLVMGFVWWKGLGVLSLPLGILEHLLSAAKILTAAAGVWAVYRLIDLLGDSLAAAAKKTESKFDDLLVPLIRRTLKVGVTVIGLVFLNDALGWELKALLTTLGIGGLALGFAARETLQNFFGSIVVLLDRPFHIGDWIKVGDMEGTVESVGFRTTRIRTFYNSLITMPNGKLLTTEVDNLGVRRYRRIKAMLSLTYDTPPEKVEAFCEGIRELIRQHPYTRKDYYHVYFNEFADSSLNILLYCFHETPDWATELRERHRLFNDILRLAQRLGVSFAFPTQTIHLHQETAAATSATPPADPFIAGRRAASTIVRETGLAGTVPPPVRLDIPPAEIGGEEDSDGDA